MNRLLAVGCSAALYALAFPPFGEAWLSWVALVPLYAVVRNQRAASAALWGALWGGLAAAAVIPWLVPTLHQHFERSLLESLALYAFVAVGSASVYYATTFGVYALARAHVPSMTRPLLFACAWVCAEYARSELGLRSPWLKLGDSQFSADWLRQVADLTGVYGVSGLLALGNATAVEVAFLFAVPRRQDALALRRQVAFLVSLFLLPLAAVLAYGARASGKDAFPRHELRVAAVHGSEPAHLRWRRGSAGAVLRHYGEPTRALLSAPHDAVPDLIVWPENALQTSVDDLVYGPPLQGFARVTPILVGAPRSEVRDGRSVSFNSVFLLRPDGSQSHYDKRRLVPFSETHPFGPLGALDPEGDLDAAEYTPGREPGIVTLGGDRIGVLVCLEALDADLARETARAGADLIVNPSNEAWLRGRGAPEQTLAQVVFRAVETRLPLVRATSGGITAIVLPDGSIRERSAETPVLMASLPIGGYGPTLYTRFGDVFVGLCASGLAVAVARAAWSRADAMRSMRVSREHA